jgi:hypothetical protein
MGDNYNHEPCPTCGGEGQREHIIAVQDWSDPTGQTPIPALQIEVCDTCDGTGYPCIAHDGTVDCKCIASAGTRKIAGETPGLRRWRKRKT